MPATRTAVWGLLVFLFFVSLYSLTGSKLQFGYIGQNIDQAEALIDGTWQARPEGGIAPVAKTGALEVAAYLPFAAVKLALERTGALMGFQQLVYVFVEPLYAALICLAFFGLALRLYRDVAMAAALTLILGLTTLIWPYSKFGMENQITLWTVVGVWALVGYNERPTLARLIWLAVSIAALLLTKITGPLHAALLVFSIGWLKLQNRWWRRPHAGRHAWIAGTIIAAGAALFLLANRWRFGGWLWGGRYGLDSELQPIPLWESAWAFLLSPNKSFFLYSPAALIALWFWAPFWRRFPSMRPVMAGTVLLTLFHLTARTWAEETWGPRRMHYLVPILILPLGMWWERRAELAGWVRRLCWVVIAFGFFVQVLAVSFDYTALTYTLGHHPRFSQENYLWNPQYNHLRFNAQLMQSAIHRSATGESLPYYLAPHYMPWTYDPKVDRAGPIPAGSEAFDLSQHDRLALWPLEQRRDWAGRPYWFSSPSSYLALGLMAAAVAGFVVLIGWITRTSNSTKE